VPGVPHDPPRHRDLPDVEIPVRQRHQNAHSGMPGKIFTIFTIETMLAE
jgi:hypothetical protein